MRLPIATWLRGYDAANLRFDVLAGVTLAAFVVPESLAYSELAGLPPATGLYAGIAAMFAYALFGSSRQLAVGVTAALAVLTAAGLSGLSGGDPARRAVLAAGATLVAGGAALLAWICRLGFLANLVSKSVLTGFSFGAGLTIVSTQLPKLCGTEGGHGEFFGRMAAFLRHARGTHLPTLAVGATALVLLLLAKRLAPKLPAALLVVVAALAAAPLLDFRGHGVHLISPIPRGLPSPRLPLEALADWKPIVALGLSLFALSYVEGVSAARSLAAKHGGHVDPNRELLAVGAGNLLAGLFHGMPTGGSLTRSAVNVEVGGRTPLSGAIGGVLVAVVVLLLAGVFANLPETVLAAVILVAVLDLLDVRALARLWTLSRREAIVASLTAVAVLLFGMLWGVITGVVLSLLDLLERAAFPHTAVLGRIPGTDSFADRARHPENQEVTGVVVLRIDASVVFANAHTVKEQVLEQIRGHRGPIRLVVLDLGASPLLDTSGAEAIVGLRATLEADGIRLRIAGATAATRDMLRAESPAAFGYLQPGLDVGQVVAKWESRPTRH
jgi:high affinity sulfate transporter 1